MADLSKLNFDSEVNYMKRSSISGSTPITLGSDGTETSYTVHHGLGYIPIIHVSYDASGNGIIWSGDKVNLYTDSSAGGLFAADPQLLYWVDTQDLTIEVVNNTDPVATGTRTIYWIIYLDYGNM